MSDLFQIIKSYSIKHDRKIKEICSPLVDYLNTPVFTYYFVEADGRFGYISNQPEFNEYYFSQKLYLGNPYFAHPSLFRSGYDLQPCTMDAETQEILKNRFQADHLFLTIHANESTMEGFIFANNNINADGAIHYLPYLDLFNKFGRYFKREAKDLIGQMRADQYNIQSLRGQEQFELPTSVPLAKEDPKIKAFLKIVSGLSPQEGRCLELFKEGKSSQATAAIMGLSQRTVEHYFENIKNKLGCSSKYELLNY